MFGFFKRKKREEGNGGGAVADAGGPVIGIVCLKEVEGLKVREVLQYLKELNGIELGGGQGKEGTWVGEVSEEGGGGMVALGMMPGPVPWSDLEGPCLTAWWWPEAREVMKDHKGHVIVSLIGSTLDPVGRAMLATRVTAAVAEVHGAVGVYWGSGTVVQSKEAFVEMAGGMTEEALPLPLWVEYRFAVGDREEPSFAWTSGMEALGHKEFEVHGTRRNGSDVIEMLMDVSHYVLVQKAELKHGQTFGRTRDEQMKIRHGKSMHEGRGEVVVLGM